MAVYQARKGNVVSDQFMVFCFWEFLFQLRPGAHFLNVLPFNQDSCLGKNLQLLVSKCTFEGQLIQREDLANGTD